jgi:hypothetical protein
MFDEFITELVGLHARFLLVMFVASTNHSLKERAPGTESAPLGGGEGARHFF